jgi:Protein of unknown function (DUF753)
LPDETSAIRGCLSDQDENVETCNKAGENCIKCSEEFCNAQNGKSLVACLTCSSETDPSCGYTQEENDPDMIKLCEALLGRENLCFAYGNVSHYVRGCLNDFSDLNEKCAENSEDCQICDGDSCNSMKVIEETCVACDSTVDDNCKSVSELQTPTLCGEGSIDYAGCYLSDKGNFNANPLSHTMSGFIINLRMIYVLTN